MPIILIIPTTDSDREYGAVSSLPGEKDHKHAEQLPCSFEVCCNCISLCP